MDREQISNSMQGLSESVVYAALVGAIMSGVWEELPYEGFAVVATVFRLWMSQAGYELANESDKRESAFSFLTDLATVAFVGVTAVMASDVGGLEFPEETMRVAIFVALMGNYFSRFLPWDSRLTE